MSCTQDIAEIQVGEHRATLRQYFGRSFTIELSPPTMELSNGCSQFVIREEIVR